MAGETLFGDDDEDDAVEVESEVVDSEVVNEDETDDMPVPDDRNTVVKPVENIEEVVDTYNQFDEIKQQLLSQNDLTEIGNSVHVNKSGWRKIATAFNLSVETLETRKDVSDGIVRYNIKARAVAPNGKSTTASGMCASNESNHMDTGTPDGVNSEGELEEMENYLKIDGKWRRLKDPREVNEHNVMATAETRAKNRAISDLVGGGEVSAEELAAKKREEILE